MNITPTIGRVMLYKPEAMQEETHAAIVAAVNTDGTVNLGVFTPDGGVYGRKNVRLVQADEQPPQSGHYCHWMSYQVGQATKTEQVQQVSNAALDAIEKRLAAMQEQVERLRHAYQQLMGLDGGVVTGEDITVESPAAGGPNGADGKLPTPGEVTGTEGHEVTAPEAA